MIARFGRRRLPGHLIEAASAFQALIPSLDAARSALTSSVPGTRLPGRPLAETVLAFEGYLAEVRERMPRWRTEEVDDVWLGADDGLAEALALAERVRTDPPQIAGFEGLIGLIDDLLAPLDAFAVAAERFRDLKRARR